jgi:hypothetical protein
VLDAFRDDNALKASENRLFALQPLKKDRVGIVPAIETKRFLRELRDFSCRREGSPERFDKLVDLVYFRLFGCDAELVQNVPFCKVELSVLVALDLLKGEIESGSFRKPEEPYEL